VLVTWNMFGDGVGKHTFDNRTSGSKLGRRLRKSDNDTREEKSACNK
jgi:hypothetical protein